jgi:DNA-binding IclR family transcriptional regulator
VFDHSGKLVGVMCAVLRSAATSKTSEEAAIRGVDEAARALSRQLGYLENLPAASEA